MSRTDLLGRFWRLGGQDEISEKFVVFFVWLWERLWRGFAEGEEQRSIEREYAYFLFADGAAAEGANDNILFVVDNFADTGLADAVFTVGQFAW